MVFHLVLSVPLPQPAVASIAEYKVGAGRS